MGDNWLIECEQELQKQMDLLSATDNVPLSHMLSQHIKEYLPSLKMLLSRVKWRVVNSRKIASAHVTILESASSPWENCAVILYSSRFLLITWELQNLYLQQIASWSEGEDKKTRVTFFPIGADALLRYQYLRDYYLKLSQDQSEGIERLWESIPPLSEDMRQHFIDCFHLGQLWVFLHEISHYLMSSLDAQYVSNIKSIVHNFVMSINVEADKLEAFSSEYEADLLATYLLLILYGERINAIDNEQKFFLFWIVSGAISAAFPSLNLIEHHLPSQTKTHPYSAHRIFLIQSFLQNMYPNENKEEFLSLSSIIANISKTFDDGITENRS